MTALQHITKTKWLLVFPSRWASFWHTLQFSQKHPAHPRFLLELHPKIKTAGTSANSRRSNEQSSAVIHLLPGGAGDEGDS